MKNLIFLTLLALPLCATPENPLVPDTWFHDLTATDGSTQQCVIFTTIPGVEYTFFHSHDLGDWTEVGKTYGLGHEFAAAMRETAPAPPPPDPENPPEPADPLQLASIVIQPSSATEGGTVVSWVSLEHGNSVQYLITGNMVMDWYSVPMFAENHGTHHFFISHPPGTVAPPEGNPVLDNKDAAMIADLEAAWSAFNTAVTSAVETARNTPPPPPPAIDAKGFWRIKADWSLDSDGDGSTDADEFALAAEGPDGNGLVGNPFNPDTDGDGNPDGDQLDSDGDGRPDAKDTSPNDGLIAFEIISLPRYAMFQIDPGAFSINDRGTVLYGDRVWKNGGQSFLTTSAGKQPAFSAYAINDVDEIIGHGDPGFDGEYFPDIFCYWKTPAMNPAIVMLGDAQNPVVPQRAFTQIPDNRTEASPRLDNDGNFFARTWITVGEESVEENTVWTVPREGPPSYQIVQGNTPFLIEPSLRWGSEDPPPLNQDPQTLLIAPGNPPPPPFHPLNILPLQLPGVQNPLLALSGNNEARVLHQGQWKKSDLYANAMDVSADGTAIGTNRDGLHAPILLNGKWTALEQAAPGLAEGLAETYELRDTSPKGWILARQPDDNGPETSETSAALLPIRLVGVPGVDAPGELSTKESTGVDGFSVGAAIPDPSAQDRLWIMAPSIAGQTDLTVHAPVHSTAPVTISADGITFNNASELVLNVPNAPVSIRATGSESGQEILADISMGETDSVSKPIGFKVMKARTVRVAMYRVHLSQGGNHGGPEIYPQAQFLEDYLRKVFLRQINADIIVTREDSPIVLDWGSNQNGFIDAVDGEDLGPEQTLVDELRAAKEQTAKESQESSDPHDDHEFGPAVQPDIRIYFMGGPQRVDNTALGIANESKATVWISADEANNLLIDRVPLTIAHEIGHIYFGRGHPDKGDGRAPLPGTQHHRRLMVSAKTTGFDSGVLTVKGEWDRAELNLENMMIKRIAP